MIKANDIRELVNRITGITGRHKLKESDADRNQLSEGEMEKVIKHVSRIKVDGSHIIDHYRIVLHHKIQMISPTSFLGFKRSCHS